MTRCPPHVAGSSRQTLLPAAIIAQPCNAIPSSQQPETCHAVNQWTSQQPHLNSPVLPDAVLMRWKMASALGRPGGCAFTNIHKSSHARQRAAKAGVEITFQHEPRGALIARRQKYSAGTAQTIHACSPERNILHTPQLQPRTVPRSQYISGSGGRREAGRARLHRRVRSSCSIYPS
jgi:hypothetical protein